MAMQNVMTDAGRASMVERPDTPLRAYAPGALARLSPEQRGRALKRKKRVLPNPSLLTPSTLPGGGGQ
jgi:hypothetical protein